MRGPHGSWTGRLRAFFTFRRVFSLVVLWLVRREYRRIREGGDLQMVDAQRGRR